MSKILPITMTVQLNREAWLTELGRLVEPMFRGYKLAPYRVTCGWPSRNALGGRMRRIGECHGLEQSKGRLHEIFISPTIADNLEVAGVVCHEIAHVAAGIKAGHKGEFIKVCKHIGLTANKPTSAAPGPYLIERLHKVIDRLGSYPHHAIVPTRGPRKKGTDVRLECPGCGCKLTISQKWLIEAGLPSCGCGHGMGVRGNSPGEIWTPDQE